jgi:acetoin utilization deacetylase AcuC-like enzyme
MTDMIIPVVTAPAHEGHAPPVEVQCGKALPAFDTVARMMSILSTLDGDELVDLRQPSADVDPHAAARRVHSPELMTFLENAWDQAAVRDDDAQLIFADTFPHVGLEAPALGAPKTPESAAAIGEYCFDTITGIGPRTYDATIGSTATALTGAGLVLNGERLAVALCRPPGHHVTRSVFGGGCYLNNAAIATQWLHDQGVAKVSVLDVDFHHGNGTQAIFYDRAETFYASLHGAPERSYPYFTGYSDEVGSGAGRGTNLNIPLPEHVAGEDYLDLLERAIDQAVTSWDTDLIVVSLGFDTFHADGSGDAQLRTEDYHAMGQAMTRPGIPVLAVLEGGYAVESLGPNLSSWIHGAASSPS